MLDQHLEHRRLRDPPGPATGQVEPEQRPRVAVKLDGVEQTVRKGVERIAQPHLPERIDTAGLEPLPAKLPREVGLAFDQRDLDIAARQQIGKRSTRGAGADDDEVRHTRSV